MGEWFAALTEDLARGTADQVHRLLDRPESLAPGPVSAVASRTRLARPARETEATDG